MKQLILLSITFLSLSQTVFAQGVGIGTAQPDSSAILDVTSTDKGMLLPRMDSTARMMISNPAQGLTVYDTSTHAFWFYDNAMWNEIRSGLKTLTPEDLYGDVLSVDSLCADQKYSLSMFNAYDMIQSGDYMYVVRKIGPTGRLYTYDISDPLAPVKLDSLNFNGYYAGSGFYFCISGPYLLMLDYNTLHVVSIEDPGSPVLVVDYSLSAVQEPVGMTACHNGFQNTVLVADHGVNLILVYEFSSPEDPVYLVDVESVNLQYYAGMAYENNVVYVGSDHALSVFDLFGSFLTFDTTIYAVSSTIVDMVKVGQYCYLIGGEDDLAVIDISTPSSPVFISETNVVLNPISLAINGDFAWVGSDADNSVTIVDISDPAVPVVRGKASGISNPVSMLAGEALVYLTDPDRDKLEGYGLKSCDFLVGLDQFNNTLTAVGYKEIDKQTLSLTGDDLSILNGNTINLGSVDNQKIDLFSLAGSTLSISLANDGESPKTVNLGSLDNQVIDSLSIVNDVLFISLDNDGEYAKTVSLSGVDNQIIDSLAVENDSLVISLADDNVPALKLDLSPYKQVPFIQDADQDTKIRVEANADEDIIRFDLGGTEYMRIDSGRIEILNTGNSIFIGEDAGVLDDYNDRRNIGIGKFAMLNNISGKQNSAVGYGSMQNNNTGSFNTAYGFVSLYHNLNGERNTAVGHSALTNLETGFYNVALGAGAGQSNSSGSGNVFLGFEAGKNESGSDKLYIENSASSSPLIWGDFANDWIKINGYLSSSSGFADGDHDTRIQVEENPDEDVIRFDVDTTELLKLFKNAAELSGSERNLLTLRTTDNSAQAGIAFRNSGAYYTWSIHRAETDPNQADLVISGGAPAASASVLPERLRITRLGNVGIGTDTVDYKLQVGTAGDGTEARANAWNTFSDRRWKTDFAVITNAIEKIDAINGYYYKWKDRPDTSTQVGVIAQEIDAILPEVVSTDPQGYKSVDYSKLAALLIQGIKEQQAVITTQQSDLLDLQEQVNVMHGRQESFMTELESIKQALSRVTAN